MGILNKDRKEWSVIRGLWSVKIEIKIEIEIKNEIKIEIEFKIQ